ncbi:MAG: hypothetical protein K940chlam7_00687 [Chlamydiae bacterium]|nr:hypothetical protein [Chlamydiota bacterium]
MRQHKVRLSVDCTENERMYIKMLAAKEKKTISEYLLSLTYKHMPKKRIPNKETQKVLRETEEGKNLENHDSLDDFWEAMGMNSNAED